MFLLNKILGYVPIILYWFLKRKLMAINAKSSTCIRKKNDIFYIKKSIRMYLNIMNKVILYGKIISDIIKKNDKAPAEFRLETVNEWRGEPVDGQSHNSEFHDIIIWGDKGIFVHASYRKGDYVLIEGVLKYRKKNIHIKDSQNRDVIVDGQPLVVTKSDVEIKVIEIQHVAKKI